MTLLVTVAAIRLGVRWGLFLLAASAVYSWLCAPRPESPVDRYRSITGGLFAVGVFLFGPAFIPALMGSPLPPLVALVIETVAIGTVCAALIYLIATRALVRNISEQRVRSGMLANCGVVMLFVVWSLWAHGMVRG